MEATGQNGLRGETVSLSKCRKKAGMGHAPAIPALGRRRQGDEFKITLSYLKGVKTKEKRIFKKPLLQNDSEESILDAS